MLPLPIVLLLLFSATLLAPSSPLLVGFIRTATLQSSTWKTLPASIPPSTSRSPPEVASLLPILVPQVPLDTLPTSCGTRLAHVAPNNTVPHSFVHVADDRTTSTAVLLVVSLALFNCFVYKLMVDEPDGVRDTDGEPEQVMVFPCATIVGSSTQESMCHHTPEIDETQPQLLSVDEAKSVSQTVEHERPPRAVTHPSFSSFEVMILSQSPSPSEQSLPFFNVLSRDFSVGSSTKATDGGNSSSAVASPASDSASIDPPPTIVTQSTDLEALTTIPGVLVMEIDDPEPELSESVLLDTDAAKDDAPPVPDLTITPPPRETGPCSELHDSPMSSPTTGGARESEADGRDVFCYQSPEFDGRGDETFDYKGVDCAPEALDPQAAATEDSAVPSPPVPSLLESHHGQSFVHAPSPSANMSSPDDINTRCLSRRTSLPPDVTPRPAVAGRYASDDIQVGMKGQSGSPIVRCASADDLGLTFETTEATEVFTISDGLTVISQRGVVDDDSAHNQATVLRAEAPIFNPRGSGVDELVLLAGPQQPDFVGLKDSIHAPQNGDISQTQECVGVSGSMHAIRRACAPATTSENTSDSLSASETASDSSGGTKGLCASVHAPQHLSTGTHQEPEGDVEKLETQLTRSVQLASSSSTDDGPQSGLTGSIRAPRPCLPLKAARRSSQHSADAPNWAAAARAEDSSTTSGVSVTAQHDNSPDPALDDGGSESPTATRCAVKDQEEGSVDSSDGSLDYADDQEGTTTGSGETDDGLDEADDPNEQDSSPQERRPRRRGKSRRHRQKAPYLPPPRMRLGHLMQHSVVDGFAARTQPPNVLAAPPPPTPLGGQYYGHLPPPPPHDPTSALRPMAPPPNIIIPNQLGPHLHYHHPRPMGSPGQYPPPIPVFQPPSPYTPTFYPHGPHPQYVPPPAPFTPLYGR